MKKYKSDYYSLMHFSKKMIALFLFIGICFTFSCTSALYMPNVKNVPENANIAELQKGRQLYISKCSSCHALFATNKYDKVKWEIIVNQMEQKAKITPIEKELIFNYLTKGGK